MWNLAEPTLTDGRPPCGIHLSRPASDDAKPALLTPQTIAPFTSSSRIELSDQTFSLTEPHPWWFDDPNRKWDISVFKERSSLRDKSTNWVSMSSYYGNILASSSSVLLHTEEPSIGHHGDAQQQKEALSVLFACGERLLGKGGKQRGLSRLNKEAMLTLKYLHSLCRRTVNSSEVNCACWFCFDEGLTGIKKQFVVCLLKCRSQMLK